MAAGAPSVLFAPACAPGAGGGHVMRCAALALALAGRGARCAFSTPPEGADILQRFFPDTFSVFAEPPDAAFSRADTLSPDVVVVDDYGRDADDERRLARSARRMVVVDDLADRPHAADLVIDPGYGREASAYAAVAPSARVLAGPAYALLRPAFARARAERPPPSPDPPQRLFIGFGLSDVGGVCARAVRLVRQAAPGLALDVALSGVAGSLPELEARAAADGRLSLHLDTPDVAALMARADAAVGAGGSASWERCALGLPSLVVVVADNQRPATEGLARDGAVIACDLHALEFEARFAEGLRTLLHDADARVAMARRAASTCDGLGAGRAAEAVLALL